MKPKLYFTRGSEICRTMGDIKDLMEGLTEVEVFEADPTTFEGLRVCRWMGSTIELGSCDRTCKGYNPSNGRSGRCRHLGNNFYIPTDKKVIIKLK